MSATSIAATVGRDGLRILETASGGLIGQIPAHMTNPVTAFDNEGATIAASSGDDVVTIWDSRTVTPVRSIKQPARVSSLQFNRDSDELIVGADDGAVYVWTVGTGALRAILPSVLGGPESVEALALNPQGTRLAVGTSDGLLAMWEFSTGKRLWKTLRHCGTILDLAYDATGNRLASAGVDGFARISDSRTGAVVANLKGHSSSVRRVRFSSDSRQLLTTSDDHDARLWQLDRFKLQSTFALSRGEEDLYGSFVDGGREVIGITTNHRIGVWRTDSGHLERTFGAGIGALEVSGNGERLVSLEPLRAGGVQMRVWNAATGDVLRTIGPYRFVDARFVGTGELILVKISSKPKGRFEVWNATTGQALLQIDDDFDDVTANQDGSLLAVTAPSAQGVRLIDGKSGHVLRVVAEEHFSPKVAVA